MIYGIWAVLYILLFLIIGESTGVLYHLAKVLESRRERQWWRRACGEEADSYIKVVDFQCLDCWWWRRWRHYLRRENMAMPLIPWTPFSKSSNKLKNHLTKWDLLQGNLVISDMMLMVLELGWMVRSHYNEKLSIRVSLEKLEVLGCKYK